MRISYFFNLAWNNLKKNHRLYIPQMLSGAGLAAIFYIILTLSMDQRLCEVKGGSALPQIMSIGVFVTGLLAVILIFYTNSFLMKQRKTELGMYHVLGMEKRHIGRILFFESLIADSLSIICGLIVGILLYKICTLIICNLLHVKTILGFYHVSPDTLVPSALFFLILYGITYLINRIDIARLKPVELLQSRQVGEKEPKIKWVFLLAGLITLGAGYTIALTVENPLDALNLFFVAVILVIIGTYCLFMAGSIALLKLLKRTDSYYYHRKHMVSVSGLLYRMKQNAVGLASITVLATCVLVMISTTVSMYAGIEDTIKMMYPNDLSLRASYYLENEDSENENGLSGDLDDTCWITVPTQTLQEIVEGVCEKYHAEIKQLHQQCYLCFAAYLQDGIYTLDQSKTAPQSTNFNNVDVFCFVTADKYRELTGKQISLKEDEIAVAPIDADPLKDSSLTIDNVSFHIKEVMKEYPIYHSDYALADSYGVVVANEDVLSRLEQMQQDAYGPNASRITENLVVDFADPEHMREIYTDLTSDISDELRGYGDELFGTKNYSMGYQLETIWEGEEYTYGIYGSLLFLGLLLALVFLFATALIIYFKQISEGYEDRERFQILQRVGMSSDEIQGTIRSQILLVFFLPLLVAGIHLTVAYPILTKLLKIFFQPRGPLFLGCCIVSFGVFGLIYLVIYLLTARTYYHIVK